MIKSENVAELFAALSVFQGQMESVGKDRGVDTSRKDPKGNIVKYGAKYSYATLGNCIASASKPLADNGLSVVQLPGYGPEGRTLTTLLCHSSGQFIGSEMTLPEAVLQGGPGANPVQVFGSQLSYVRRYMYAAILGLRQEDDDGASCGPSQNNNGGGYQKKLAPKKPVEKNDKGSGDKKKTAPEKKPLKDALSWLDGLKDNTPEVIEKSWLTYQVFLNNTYSAEECEKLKVKYNEIVSEALKNQ